MFVYSFLKIKFFKHWVLSYLPNLKIFIYKKNKVKLLVSMLPVKEIRYLISVYRFEYL